MKGCTDSRTNLERFDTNGGRPSSGRSRLGGVLSRVGGVEASDNPEDPAVEGRFSRASTFFGAFFFLCGTPSGQVHYQGGKSQATAQDYNTYLSLAMNTTDTVGLGLVTLLTAE